jgi:uncharacterized membrane protein
MYPFNSISGSIITGVVLVIVLLLTIHGINDTAISGAHVDRWLHIVSGVTWIGLLYYFNVVHVPGVAAAGADKGGPGPAGLAKYIAPQALLWFRWAAVATWVTGAYYLSSAYGDHTSFVKAFTLQPGFRTIGIGAWLGTIMLFNVWVFIWPNQKKILGIVAATDEEKAKARKTALYASRTNFMLSLPMLMCMAGHAHGLAF